MENEASCSVSAGIANLFQWFNEKVLNFLEKDKYYNNDVL